MAARETQRLAAWPDLELTGGLPTNYGPYVDVLLLGEDLDRVVVELVQEPNEVTGGAEQIVGLHMPNVSGRRIDLGSMRTGERKRLQVGAQGIVHGLTVRLRCECSRGPDSWTVPLSATLPRRDEPPLWQRQGPPRPGG